MNFNEGVHVRGFAETQKDAPDIARLTVQIWPLPYEVVADLNEHLKQETNKFLASRQIVSGDLIDISAPGKAN